MFVDIYDLAGTPTATGLRAFGEMYGDKEHSGVAIRRIDECGGIIVGKTKCSK